jgi:diamine N-acetyltransferase
MKSIRYADIQDLPLIKKLAHEIWPVAYGSILSPGQLSYMLDLIYSLPALQKQITTSGHTFVFVINESEPVGFASFSPKEGDPSIIRLHKIYILPREQGRGTGKFLLQFVIQAAKEMGAEILELNVNRHNKARYFYEKNGFVISREVDIDIGDGYFMNDYIMEYSLI